ncbi:MAG: GNAT family N-acetyltransferase [Phycisphaerae bacterium]|nr:GNAT family N-acetyltransferase [Phycisphaerae bacterium]
MNATDQVSSITAAGPGLGRRIEQHMVDAFRAALQGAGAVHEPGQIRMITGAPHPFGNFALMVRGDDPDGVSRAAELLSTCGAPAAILTPGKASAPVDALLRERGFAPHDPMPAMAVDIERMPQTALPQGYELFRVDGADGGTWADVFAIGYELPPVVARVFAPNGTSAGLSADATTQYFAVRKDGRWVATSMIFLHDGLAGVYCVATIPEERGKGLGAYATAEPLRQAFKVGYRVGVLQSSPSGYKVYKRLGFGDFGGVSLYVRMPQ